MGVMMKFLNTDKRKIAIVSTLLLTFATQVVILPVLGWQTIAVFPEVEWLFAPALAWSIVVICCIQAILLILLRLLTLADDHHIFHPAVTGWMLAMTAITVAGIGLLLFGHVVLNELGTYPPLVFITIWLLIVSGAIFALILGKAFWQIRKSASSKMLAPKGYQTL